MDADTASFLRALLDEIAAMLARLADGGVEGAVDLQGLPLAAEARAALAARLGRGEVEVRLDLGGISEIHETAYPGLWWVRHCAPDGRVTSERIEVTPVPDILRAGPADIAAAAARLSHELATTEETQHG